MSFVEYATIVDEIWKYENYIFSLYLLRRIRLVGNVYHGNELFAIH